MNTELLQKNIFTISPDVRYVAIYVNDRLTTSSRENLANASASESDKYEELIVNPTLLRLVTQRGNIDCGGVGFVIIRYGSFYQLVMPLADGHVSVGIELNANLLSLVTSIQSLVHLQ